MTRKILGISVSNDGDPVKYSVLVSESDDNEICIHIKAGDNESRAKIDIDDARCLYDQLGELIMRCEERADNDE